jgi:hypothetical protein
MNINANCELHQASVSLWEYKVGKNQVISQGNNIKVSNKKGKMIITCAICDKVLYSGKKSEVIEEPKPKGKLLVEIVTNERNSFGSDYKFNLRD